MRLLGSAKAGFIAAGAILLSVCELAAGQMVPLPAHPNTINTPRGLLTPPAESLVHNATQLNRGRYLAAAGDCLSCHVRDGGQPFAGGLGLNTPFGVIYSANITPDRDTGIGAWTSAQFYGAMHNGVG